MPAAFADLKAGTMAEILVVDDEPQIRCLLVRVLNGAGHTVHEAGNGQEAIRQFRRVRPGLVITDIVMPGMEGIELIRELRQQTRTTPILAISGGGPPLYLRAATDLGATAALAKPFGAAELLELVDQLLET